VWAIELGRPLDPGIKIDSILSIDERHRAERFVFAKDALRFRLCRAMLRMGLAWYLDKAPQEIILTTDSRGKPYLAESSALHFNVTHCEGLGLIAFTTLGEVGIDVEDSHRDVEALDVASANFTSNETAMIAAAETLREQASVFLRLWTRKEAVLKASGHGIQGGLATFDVSQQPPAMVKLSRASDVDSETCWLVQDLELANEFTGAVAAPAGDWSILQWPVRSEDLTHLFLRSRPGLL
jgi:4'-phosphopantetheinyl transferase